MHKLPLPPEYNINMRVMKDNAQANGSDRNIVEAYVYSSETMLPEIGLSVVFRVDGSATIVESNSPAYPTVTDGNGKVSINVTDIKEEIVTATIYIQDATSYKQQAEIKIKFAKPSSAFRIKEAVNKNHAFLNSEPTYAWKGASFTIHTEGGRGKITWEVHGPSTEVIVEGNDSDRSAGVTILNQPNQPCKIIATDTETGESDEYVFSVKTYVNPMTNKKVSLETALDTHEGALMSPREYEQLYKEWGNMEEYSTEGWKVGTEYWTTEYNWLRFTATVFNAEFGTHSESLFRPALLHKKYYAFKVGI